MHETAKLVVMSKDIEMLFVQSQKYWTLPGGKLEEGESITQALIRELDEEIPLLTGQSWKHNVYKHMNLFIGIQLNQEDYLNNVFITDDYLAKQMRAGIFTVGREIQDFKWVKPEEHVSDYWDERFAAIGLFAGGCL